MKTLFKILFIFCILFAFCSCTNNKEQDIDLLHAINSKQEFVVGINTNSKPFGYINEQTKHVEGFDADLIRLISLQLFENDKIIKFIPVTPSNRIYKLNGKEIDVIISTMTITPERQRVVDFSNPYFMTGQAILVNKNDNIKTGKDLNYKNVGIVLGTTAANNIHYIVPNANIKGFKNYKNAFAELQKGNIDAISTDDVILQQLAKEHNQYKVLQDRYSTEFYGIAYRKDKESLSLKNAIDETLVYLEKTGKIKELEVKYDIAYKR